MTLDDESILSAYLDGQLGPEEQQAVESAVCADPRLAEELRSLAALRDLVAGLPREAPIGPDRPRDAAGPPLASRSPGVGDHRLGPGPCCRLVGIAAGVLALLALPWWLHLGHRPAGDGLAAGNAWDAVDPAARPAVSERLWPHFAGRGPGAGRAAGPSTRGSRPRPAAEAGPGSPGGELLHVREYLDNPRLRRIFVVSDLDDDSARRQVASIVEQTTRFNFYKFTISQGIVIDPRHPDQATVFALAVGPRELEDLRDGLRAALKGRVEETDVEPAVVAQLADIGQVEACRPAPASPMAIPGDALALKRAEDAGAAADGVAPPPARIFGPAEHHALPTPEQERSSPRFEVANGTRPKASGADTQPGPGLPRAGDQAEEPVVVLVWVARARPGSAPRSSGVGAGIVARHGCNNPSLLAGRRPTTSRTGLSPRVLQVV